MNIYRNENEQVEAFQFTPGCSLPEWFRQAIENNMAFYNKSDDPYYTVETQTGSENVFTADWILKKESGEIEVMPPVLFSRKYKRS